MERRDFLKMGLSLGGTATLGACGAAGSRPESRPVVIDAHCHAGKGLNYGKEGGPYAPWTTYNDPEETLRKMEEAGIDKTVIFPISNETHEEANKEIAGYVQRWPDKLIGFAKHDGKREAGRIGKMLRHEVRELGLRGLKLHGFPTPEMLDACAELRIPILFHPAKVDDCHEAVKSRPEINFIMAHLGSFATRRWQEHRRAIEVVNMYPNLHVETSSVVMFRYLEQAARELPPEKLIFGTDGPLVDSRIELAKIRLLKLPPEHEAKILSGNILRILGG